MVTPVRKGAATYSSAAEIGGLFVIGKSNAESLEIPHLPVLHREDSNQEYGMPIFSDDKKYNGKGIISKELFSEFSDGDIVWLDPRFKTVRTILSYKANANTLLVTERCENRCLFCSQPPNDLEDVELYKRATLSILNFNSSDYVGITGGEPTYNRDAFIKLLDNLNNFGNKTPLHILTHGRNFSDRTFAQQVWSAERERDILWGIPLYGHKASLHDQLVRGPGAFTQTVQGLLNFGEAGQAIELRIIPTQQNLPFLPNIISFLSSNFRFIEVISIMNIEPKGWGRNNFDSLYVPVKQQNRYLLQAVEIAELSGLAIRLFNYPLCLLEPELRQYACKSISDWKNYYPDDCARCKLKPECGGFFTSASGKFIETVEAQL